MAARASRQAAVEIRGLGASHVRDVHVTNSVFSGISSGGNRISNADNVTFTDTTINGDPA